MHLINILKASWRKSFLPSHLQMELNVKMTLSWFSMPPFGVIKWFETHIRTSCTVKRETLRAPRRWWAENETHTHTHGLGEWLAALHIVPWRKTWKQEASEEGLFSVMKQSGEREIWAGGKERRICLLNLRIIILITEEWKVEKKKSNRKLE